MTVLEEERLVTRQPRLLDWEYERLGLALELELGFGFGVPHCETQAEQEGHCLVLIPLCLVVMKFVQEEGLETPLVCVLHYELMQGAQAVWQCSGEILRYQVVSLGV